jgi:hypothetical protein
MMVDWMKPQEAANYLGVRLEDVVALVKDENVETDVVLDDNGTVLAIKAADLREPLFEIHRKKHGHRPDDLKHMEKAEKEYKEKEERERQERQAKLQMLAPHVSIPHE